MQVFYRISSRSYPKIKLPGATKEFCLRNFLSCFDPSDVIIIADNCDDDLLSLCKSTSCDVRVTEAGNAGSFRIAMDLALQFEDDEVVYFVEDDYLHWKVKGGGLDYDPVRELQTGVWLSDYATLFNHPDKYTLPYCYGEKSKFYRTRYGYWKNTVSTTMTFATTVRCLKKDQEVWRKYTEEKHPHDHLAFSELGENKLVCHVPGISFHVDLTMFDTSRLIDGTRDTDIIDPWVIELLRQDLLSQCKEKPSNLEPMLEGYGGVEQLMVLSAVNSAAADESG